MKVLSRTEAKENIEDFFENIKSKTPEEIKKTKRLASHYHIRLGDKRKQYCKYCFSTKLKIKKVSKKSITRECLNSSISLIFHNSYTLL